MNEYEAVVTLRKSLHWLDETNISNDELDKTQEAIETLWESARAWDKAIEKERKALLVINMPRNCYECLSCMFTTDGKWECFQTGKRPDELFSIPDWCPLIPFPERKQATVQMPTGDGRTFPYEDKRAEGWNACIDALEGKHD